MALDDETLMRRAIDLARRSVAEGGGPFGAVIVRDGVVVSEAGNRVTLARDPTAHAEIEAIRAACRELDTHRLDGCTVYTSCEPCPMCLAALYWAHVDRVVYAAGRADAARAGFDDERLYRELAAGPGDRELSLSQVLRDEALEAFSDWARHEGRTEY